MSETSAIEWTDATANFWRGCEKVSPGCAHCYMFTAQRRYGRDPDVVVRCSRSVFNAPLSAKWRRAEAEIREREGRRMRVFTCSWSDFFHEDADPWRAEAWDIIRRCPQYDWQILTKRPERIAECLPEDWGDGWEQVWLGVSIENRRFVHRAELLRQTLAAVRFISAEPLLGPLRAAPLERWQQPRRAGFETGWMERGRFIPELDLRDIDWLIVGGESGAGHRPMRVEWARDLRDAATGIGTAFFFKQWGGRNPKSGGRLLDGRTWDETPQTIVTREESTVGSRA